MHNVVPCFLKMKGILVNTPITNMKRLMDLFSWQWNSKIFWTSGSFQYWPWVWCWRDTLPDRYEGQLLGFPLGYFKLLYIGYKYCLWVNVEQEIYGGCLPHTFDNDGLLFWSSIIYFCHLFYIILFSPHWVFSISLLQSTFIFCKHIIYQVSLGLLPSILVFVIIVGSCS